VVVRQDKRSSLAPELPATFDKKRVINATGYNLTQRSLTSMVGEVQKLYHTDWMMFYIIA